jgi:hypothetical protein
VACICYVQVRCAGHVEHCQSSPPHPCLSCLPEGHHPTGKLIGAHLRIILILFSNSKANHPHADEPQSGSASRGRAGVGSPTVQALTTHAPSIEHDVSGLRGTINARARKPPAINSAHIVSRLAMGPRISASREAVTMKRKAVQHCGDRKRTLRST